MSDWTNAPPTEPGFWWARCPGNRDPNERVVVRIFTDGEWLLQAIGEEDYWRLPELTGWTFWPQRIEPPK